MAVAAILTPVIEAQPGRRLDLINIEHPGRPPCGAITR
jgi:hypothetical protein